jgi:hypothetical protein
MTVVAALFMTVSFASGVMFLMALVASVGLDNSHIKRDIQLVSRLGLVVSAAVFLTFHFIERSLY